MTKKIYQNLISQIRDIVKEEAGIIEESGTIIACSDQSRVGQVIPCINEIISSEEQMVIHGGVTYNKIRSKGKTELISYVMGCGENFSTLLSLITINIINIKNYYDEKFDKGSFLKNVIFGDALPGDIAVKCKELHIQNNVCRVVFLIRTEKTKDIFVYEVIQGLFPNRSKDFVVVLDNESIVLIKEIKSKDDTKDIEKTARIIIDTLNTESMVKACIGIGTAVENLADIKKSFKEAQIALQVGNIFENDKLIMNYNSLGLGRLIYQLPENLCSLFLKEVFKDGTVDSLDGEYMLTIQKFFENNLNVSETSRQMFVHRNTLVYRLDKIQKTTGLDLTKFDDAIIFKFAMLVKRYLDKAGKLV